jgi:hypothetical protein
MLDALRSRFEELLESVARTELGLSTGEGPGEGVGALHERERDLFSLDRLSEVQLALSGAAAEQAKRVRYLLEGLASARGVCAAASELDQWVTWRANAHVAVGEERVAVGRIAGTMAGERDPELRHAVEVAWLEALDTQTPLLEGAFTGYRRGVEEVGYGDLVQSMSILSGIDLAGLEADGRAFLAGTEAPFLELLDWHLTRLVGVDRRSATQADGLALERAAAADEIFAGRDPATTATSLVGAGGLDTTAGGRLRLRPLPSGSRAVGSSVLAVRVPDEVVVLHGRRSGRAAHAAALRGLGAGCHHAFTAAALPLEYRRLGDDSVPHAFGLLYESLVSNPIVLERELRVGRARIAEQRRLAALLELMAARGTAARLAFETWWHREPEAQDRGARYAEEMTAATGLRHDPRTALADCVPPLRSARELRGRQLAPVLIDNLRDRFDEDWYRNPDAVPVLTELMVAGRTYAADELAVRLGEEQLDFAPARARVEELLG